MLSVLKSAFREAVEAVQPRRRIPDLVSVVGNSVVVAGRSYAIAERPGCSVVGFGKAVSGMAVALERILGPALIKTGAISVPKGFTEAFASDPDMVLSPESKIATYEGAQSNIPDEDAFEASKAILRVVDDLRDGDLLFVLVSGGGSALLPHPAQPLTLEEKSDLVRTLSAAGADIMELNAVRKRLSAVKGGKLAARANRARVVSFILSDIVGDPLDFIASAPTVRSADPPGLAADILGKYSVELTDGVRAVLDREPDYQGDLGHVQNVLIGNNGLALDSLVESFRTRDFSAFKGSQEITGEARILGRSYARAVDLILTCGGSGSSRREAAAFLEDALKVPSDVAGEFVSSVRKLKNGDGPGSAVCLVCGGEPTVTVKGGGKGGRNQELALAFAAEVREAPGVEVWLMSAGTDGIDGPTDAAGAAVSCSTAGQAREQGVDAVAHLDDNDSHGFFSRLNGGADLISVGHTGTNVMDVHVLLLCLK